MKILHVILDRDGVLNREGLEDWVVDREYWHWEPGSLEAIVALTRAGVQISVATNQSCVGRGIADAEAVEALHAWVLAEAARHGARIERILYCPHIDADGCRCRKPKAQMLVDAAAQSGVPCDSTLAVGDSRRDLEAGRSARMRTALVRTGKGHREEAGCLDVADWVFDDLCHAAQCIVGLQKFPGK